MPELLAQPFELIGKRRLRAPMDLLRRLLAQERAEAADKKTETHGSSFVQDRRSFQAMHER